MTNVPSNLPAAKTTSVASPRQTRSVAALGIATVVIVGFAYLATHGFLEADYIIAGCGLFGVLLSLWSLGSLYITIPLSMKFMSAYYGSQDYAAIDRAHSRALKMLSRLPLRKRVDIAVTMSNLALARLCQGYYDSAESLYTQAAKYIEKNPRLAQSVTPVVIYHNLAVTKARQNKFVEAELHATRALEIAQLPKVQKTNKMVAAAPLSAIGYIRYKLGEFVSAKQMLLDAISTYESSPLAPGLSRQGVGQGQAAVFLGLCAVTIKLDQQSESEQWCDKFFETISSNPNVVTTMSLIYLNDIANEYMNRKMFDRAQKLLDLAYSLGHKFPFHPDAIQMLNYYEKLLLLTDRQYEVADMRSWLRSVESPAALQKQQ
ncbi:MAG TPA: tetratricopeptide repeat protein [Candidatus Obscuribacterales bacterium]